MPIDAEIYYHLYEGGTEGSKPPVVLIHGAGGTHLYWPSEIRRLAGFRVYALDLPGHGKSSGRGHQTIEQYVQSVLEWLEALQFHRVMIVGHSMGGAIAMTLALAYPERVLALGLVSAASRLWVPADVLEQSASLTTYRTAIDRMVASAFAPQTPARLRELAAERMAETRYTVLHGDFLACEAFDLTSRLPEITASSLVITGAQDAITSPRDTQFLASSLPHASLETIPEAGHMVMLEQPQATARALQEFLQRVSY